MKVEGDEAKLHNAVRLDNFTNANQGVLTYADDVTGLVKYTDRAGEQKSVELGSHAIRIMRTGR